MVQAIKNNIVLLVTALTLAVAGVALPSTVAAQNIEGSLKCGSNFETGTNCTTSTNGSSDVMGLITDVINIFSLIVGAVAVIMIILGGFKYITSGGDSNNIGSAKNTILYAIVGLVIVAFAQAIVHFVLGEI